MRALSTIWAAVCWVESRVTAGQPGLGVIYLSGRRRLNDPVVFEVFNGSVCIVFRPTL